MSDALRRFAETSAGVAGEATGVEPSQHLQMMRLCIQMWRSRMLANAKKNESETPEPLAIRILFRSFEGSIEDGQLEFDTGAFAGMVPAIGDTILDPGVPSGMDRNTPRNREVWAVVGRVFNPKDFENSVALIVERRSGTDRDSAFL